MNLPMPITGCHDPAMIERSVHLAANAMFMTDRHGRICWANAAFSRLYDYGYDEILGNTPDMLGSGAVPRENYRQLWDTISAGRTWRGRMVNRRRDGAPVEIVQTITPVCDCGGDVTHYFVVYDHQGPAAGPC